MIESFLIIGYVVVALTTGAVGCETAGMDVKSCMAKYHAEKGTSDYNHLDGKR